MKTDNLKVELQKCGAAEENILLLDAPSPDTINYLDLIPCNKKNFEFQRDWIYPEAIIETENEPVLYVIQQNRLAEDSSINNVQLKQILHNLACRGGNTHLAILSPGHITVYPVVFTKTLPEAFRVERKFVYTQGFLRDLETGVFQQLNEPKRGKEARQQAVHKLLFKLLTHTTSELLNTTSLKNQHDVVLSLVGRVLFTRFLIDRAIINTKTFPRLKRGMKLEECFSNAENAAFTCRWLDRIFNGDLLPLWEKKYTDRFNSIEKRNKKVFGILSDIMLRAPGGQQTFDIYWNDLDFSHIPIGLLSEVYEHYAHEFFGKDATNESIHYTPRHIAQFMVNQSFPGVRIENPDKAHVLDPAAGAGVFLVLAFRKLVAERWRRNKRRPSTREIHGILNKQLCGLDINSHALKLAALSLYLTALELDPDPYPAEKLHFERLEGRVLINTRQGSEKYPYGKPILGSLGLGAPTELNARFDLVISNPPWTAWKGAGSNEINKQCEEIIRNILKNRNLDTLSERAEFFENSDKNPDIPFLWRSLEWAKPGGIISLALHGRWLFKHINKGTQVRNTLFSAIKVTGILNAAALRQTEVWPDVSAPFCLLFAENKVPKSDDRFYFISPELEQNINKQGRFRVDYNNAYPVTFDAVSANPSLFKTLFRGMALDVDIMRKLSTLDTVKIVDYWESKGLKHGQGFQVASKKKDASHMLGNPELTVDVAPKFILRVDALPLFSLPKLHTPRDPDIYKAPLLLMREAVKSERDEGYGILSFDDVVYNESFYGYSGFGSESGEVLVRYLYILTYSNLLQYYILMTSAKFGVERESILKKEIDEFPLIPLERLSEYDFQVIKDLSNAIAAGQCPWEKLDTWIANIYHLSQSDLQVISDTLNTRSPFARAKKLAQRNPTEKEIEDFSRNIEMFLQPFFNLTDEKIIARTLPAESTSWKFVEILTENSINERDDFNILAHFVNALSSQSGASRIILEDKKGKGRLVLGILAEYRYWTPSRARLCALDILKNHGAVFPVEKEYA